MTERVVTESLALGAYGNCAINSWFGYASDKEFAALNDFMSKAAAQYKDGVILFVLINPGTPMLTGEQRKQTDAFYTRWGGSFRAAAQVVEGGDLWSLSARSIMTALRLVQRRAYPTRVFADVREGAEWAAPLVTPPANENSSGPLTGILAELQHLRAPAAWRTDGGAPATPTRG